MFSNTAIASRPSATVELRAPIQAGSAPCPADGGRFSHVLDLVQESTGDRIADSPTEVPTMGWISELAHRDPVAAGHLLDAYTFGTDFPVVSLINPPDPFTGATARYIATGELETPEREHWFRNEADRLRSERISLHDQEIAKGTPVADILDRVLHFMDAQDPDYLNLINWQVISGRTPRSED